MLQGYIVEVLGELGRKTFVDSGYLLSEMQLNFVLSFWATQVAPLLQSVQDV